MKKRLVKGLCMVYVMLFSVSTFAETVITTQVEARQEAVITDVEEMYKLGEAYLFGLEEGIPQDIDQAKYWFEQASAKGHTPSTIMLGWMHIHVLHATDNPLEAFKCYKKAAMQGDPAGAAYVGMMYLQGLGVQKNIKDGLKWLEIAEQNATKDTYVLLGNAYEFIMDINKAIQYYNKAIANGNPNGYGAVGDLYYCGRGVEKDMNKAKSYYLKGAQAGDAFSMACLDSLYLDGYFGTENKQGGIKWREKAASLNQQYALFNYGIMHEKGQGVPINKALAREYYIKGAKANPSISAVEGLIRCAKTYDNINTDKTSALAALQCYKRAANLGDAISMISVGVFYEKGYGVEANFNEATKWFKKAFDTNDRNAINYLLERGFVSEN